LGVVRLRPFPAEIEMLVARDFAAPPLSVTWTVKLKDPLCVGVPVTAPLELLSVKPGGRDPVLMDQVYGGVPPDAESPCEYAVPTVPPANVPLSVRGETGAVMDML
jgi:hypothetical protein